MLTLQPYYSHGDDWVLVVVEPDEGLDPLEADVLQGPVDEGRHAGTAVREVWQTLTATCDKICQVSIHTYRSKYWNGTSRYTIERFG